METDNNTAWKLVQDKVSTKAELEAKHGKELCDFEEKLTKMVQDKTDNAQNGIHQKVRNELKTIEDKTQKLDDAVLQCTKLQDELATALGCKFRSLSAEFRQFPSLFGPNPFRLCRGTLRNLLKESIRNPVVPGTK